MSGGCVNSPDDGTVDATDLARQMQRAEIDAARQRADLVAAFYNRLRQRQLDEDTALSLTVWQYWSEWMGDG